MELLNTKYHPTFLCFTEHWCNNDQLDSLKINGYSQLVGFARSRHIRGGVVAYVELKVFNECKPIEFVGSFTKELILECCGFQYQSFCIIIVYRPTSGNKEEFLDIFSGLLNKVVSKFENIIICGDLNIDKVYVDKYFKTLSDTLHSFQLYSLVNTPTRIFTDINGRTSVSSLDYVVSNNPNQFLCANFDPGLSDHHCQVAYFVGSIMENNAIVNESPKKRRLFTRSNINEFNFYFEDSIISSDEDVDISFNQFFNNFMWCFNLCFPLKLVNSNSKLTHKIKFSIELQNKLDQLKKLNWLKNVIGDLNVRDRYRTMKKEINKVIKLEKDRYFNNLIQKSNNKTKKTWEVINYLNGKNRSNPTIESILLNNSILDNDGDIANAFGTYLSNVIQETLLNNLGPRLSSECTTGIKNFNTMFFFPVNQGDVHRVIETLPNKRTTGFDEVPIYLLKNCNKPLLRTLAELMNISVRQGKFPEQLKMANIIPIFKKGDKQALENYRPISITSCFSKIFEKLMYNQLVSFLDKNNVLSQFQHGFRQGRSTETAMVGFIQDIYERMDVGEYVVAVLFDLTRAFDTICPSFVSRKLNHLGIRGNVNNWLTSIIKDKQFKVKIGNRYSDTFISEMGTPQGSILGPLIFLLFVNDLPLHIKEGSILMYADDTTISIFGKSEKDILVKLKCILDEFSNWCSSNNLIINYNKTVCLEFRSKHRIQLNIRANFHGFPLTFTDTAKLLGVTFDCHLDFSKHIDELCSKINSHIYGITRLKNSLGRSALLTSYFANIHSIIGYGIILWGQSSGLDRVLISQKRALRIIFDLKPLDSCREIFKKHNILTAVSLYVHKLLIHVHKTKDMYTKNNFFHCYSTRHADNFSLPLHKHEFFKKSPIYSGTFLYNLLPKNFKSLSLHSFKKKLRSLLCAKTCYCLNDIPQCLMKESVEC